MRKSMILAAIAASVALTACDYIPFLPKSTEGLLTSGEWDCKGEGMPAGTKVSITFKKGGKLVISMKGGAPSAAGQMNIDADINGDWKLKEKKLTLSADDVDVNEITLNGQKFDPAAYGMSMSAMEEQMAAGFKGDKGKMEIDEIDKDELVLKSEEDGSSSELKCEH